MTCSACGRENPAGNRFCGRCGAPLERPCAVCQHTNPPDHRFCGGCGAGLETAAPPLRDIRSAATKSERAPRAYTPKHLAEKILQSKSVLEGERKQVTALFADVKGAMDLAEQLEPEEWHEILDRLIPPSGSRCGLRQNHPVALARNYPQGLSPAEASCSSMRCSSSGSENH